MKYRFQLLAMIWLCLTLPVSAASLVDDLNQLLEDQPSFSGVLEIRQGDKLLYSGMRGMADREAKQAWSTATDATVGSITKQFTAAGIMKLAEQSKLELESSLGSLLPELAESSFRLVTIHQLLTHSAGIPDIQKPDNVLVTSTEMLRHVERSKPMFAPGEQYEYSNIGYSLLALIIERVSGDSYDTYLKTALFDPAGLNRTGYQIDFGDELAKGYFPDGESVGTMRDDIYLNGEPSWLLRGNGGIYASNKDLHQWCLSLARGDVLKSEWVEQMWSPQIDETNGEALSFYGYGWVVVPTRAFGKVLMHNGDDGFGVFFNDYACMPEHEISIVMRTNSFVEANAEILVLALQRLAQNFKD